MGTTALRIDNLSVQLGTPKVDILRNVSLDVTEGEILAIVGKSGTGKSTLIAVLSGLITPSDGTIEKGAGLDGSVRTATVFQDAYLFPWLNVLDNVALSLRLKSHPRRITSRTRRRARALEILQTLELEGLADRYPEELSGGQQQRVAIARAVAAESDVLLLDEPFSALDVSTRASLQEWLVSHRSEITPTVVLVTHDLSEALYVADRIALISHEAGALDVWTSDVSERHTLADSAVKSEIEQRFFSPTHN